MGGPAAATGFSGHQPGYRSAYRHDFTGRRGRCRARRGCCTPGLHQLVAQHGRRTPGIDQPGAGGLSRPAGRDRYRDQRRDGCTAGLCAQVAGRHRHWPPGDDARGAAGFCIQRGTRRDAAAARAGRCLWLHHALELADQPDRLQGGAGAGCRLHDGAEAERDRAAVRQPVRPGHARGRCTCRGVQPRAWRWAGSGAGHRRASGS